MFVFSRGMPYSVEWRSLRHRLRPILSAGHGKMLGEGVFTVQFILCVRNRGCRCQAPYTPGGTIVTCICLWEAGSSWWCHKDAILLLARIPPGTAVSVEAAALPIVPHSFLC